MRAAFLLIALGLLGCVLPPTSPGTEQIAFVQLRFSTDGVQVVSVESAPGRLKPSRSGTPPTPDRPVSLEVTARGAVVWRETLPDPLVRRIEYVGDDGQLASREERLDEAVVTVRVPAVASRQTLTFSRLSEAGRTVIARVEVSL